MPGALIPGALREWPAWNEYTFEKGEKGPSLTQYKEGIVARYGEEALRQSWLKVCAELEKVTDEIAEKGSSIIPEIAYDDFFKLSVEEQDKIKSVGGFVVRQAVSEELATEWFNDAKTYVADNKTSVTGWPDATPFVLNVYWSPSQQAARSHPRQLKLQRAINTLWHDEEGTTSPEPLSYADAIRIRPPGVPFYGLGPHIDAGSLSRWVDPGYIKVYDSIFGGHPEEFNAYDLTTRKRANQAHFKGFAHSSVLRSFQGWTALTKAAPREGSLLLYPNVKTAIAYVLLRPFFSQPKEEKDIMDATKWTFDVETPWFPGTWREDSQYVSPTSHPHLRLHECMLHIPPMQAGDTIWWHCDMLHAVEVDHIGDHEASVVYVGAVPMTEVNTSYIKGQLQKFISGGQTPHDFEHKDLVPESTFKGFLGEKGILGGDEGRKAFGFDL